MPLSIQCAAVSSPILQHLCFRTGNTRARCKPTGRSLATLQKAAGNPLDISTQNTPACSSDTAWLGHKWEALSQGHGNAFASCSFPTVARRRDVVEIAKLFLLFILLFSCLKPAGSVDDEDAAPFLSDQLLAGLARQGGSFPGEMSKDKSQK